MTFRRRLRRALELIGLVLAGSRFAGRVRARRRRRKLDRVLGPITEYDATRTLGHEDRIDDN